MLKETIASMLKSVTSKTAPITNEAIDDTMRRVRTLAITSHEPITAAALQATREILVAAQAKNASRRVEDLVTGSTTKQSEVSEFTQRREALAFALSYYGLDFDMGADCAIVRAGLDTTYPIGGTPIAVVTRSIEDKFDCTLPKTVCEQIFNALGQNLDAYPFADLVKTGYKTASSVNVPFTRIGFVNLITALFTDETNGWKARKYLLSKYGITEA